MRERDRWFLYLGRFSGSALASKPEGFIVFILISYISYDVQRISYPPDWARRAWSAAAQHSLVRGILWCGRKGLVAGPGPTSLGTWLPLRHCEAGGQLACDITQP